MTIKFEFQLFGSIKKKRGKWFVAYCPPLDLTTQGKTLEEARKNLIEASQLFIISCLERGTLDQALRELGFVPISHQTPAEAAPAGSFQFPVPRTVKKLERPKIAVIWMIGVRNEPQSRTTAMEQNPGFQMQPGTMPAFPASCRDVHSPLHAPHDEARHSGWCEKPKKVRPLFGNSTVR